MKVRVRFAASVEVEGDTLFDCRCNFQDLNLFSYDALCCNAEYIEVESAEDADTNETIDF